MKPDPQSYHGLGDFLLFDMRPRCKCLCVHVCVSGCVPVCMCLLNGKTLRNQERARFLRERWSLSQITGLGTTNSLSPNLSLCSSPLV